MNQMRLLITLPLVFALSMCTVGTVVAQAPEEITNSIGLKLLLIPKGTFAMGAYIEDRLALNDEEQHQVTISNDYYLGMTEVTQGQYEKVMGTNPSHFQKQAIRESDSSMHPVERVSWEDAVEFCKRLSELPEENKAGRVYRLPTEAEWEYACRAGSKTAFSFGESANSMFNTRYSTDPMHSYAWFYTNSGSQTHPVGEKKPNAWGLYDMHGNVWEWCSDWSGDYAKGAVTDPAGPKEGSSRVYRGGSWFTVDSFCRSAYRSDAYPSCRICLGGFRLALSSTEVPN